jgi:hypothetical protein
LGEGRLLCISILKIECEIIIRQKANANERSKKSQSNKKKTSSQVRRKNIQINNEPATFLVFPTE